MNLPKEVKNFISEFEGAFNKSSLKTTDGRAQTRLGSLTADSRQTLIQKMAASIPSNTG